jgi:hypothetical protein
LQAEQNIGQLLLGRLDYMLMNPWNIEVLLNEMKKPQKVPLDAKIKVIGEPIILFFQKNRLNMSVMGAREWIFSSNLNKPMKWIKSSLTVLLNTKPRVNPQLDVRSKGI